MSMRVPRYIYAIGGAGKNLVYTTLEKEWIIKDILLPRPSATTIDVIIIDTAIQEKNDDLERIENIRNKIKEIQDEYYANPAYSGKNVGRINIDYKLLTQEMILNGPYDLVGIGEQVKAVTGEPIWWLDDPQLGDDWSEKVMNFENLRNSNFALGVYRKRAIGKAIYYKALGARIFKPNILENDQVDIIVGIGGGTGSGIAIDLAKRLKNIQNNADITLFGILSTLHESSDEKANSFAMLGELEYSVLKKDKTFKHIILVPMEMTGFPGRLQARHEHEILLREFDETFPYILVSYHNNQAQQLFDTPDCAPFTIATSQLVRYNVESIKKFKEMLDAAFQDKETSLKDEAYIYGTVKKFVDRYYTDDKPGFLLDADKSFVGERFTKFKDILDNEFFSELEYNSVVHVKSAVDSGVKDIIDVEKQIEGVRDQVGLITIEDKDFKDDVDTRLFKVLKSDIEMAEMLKNTLNLINKVQDDVIKDALKLTIKADKINLSRKLRQVLDEINNLTGTKRQLETNITSLRNEMRDYEEKIRKEIESRTQEWRNNESKNLDDIDSIDKFGKSLGDKFASLKNELDIFVAKMSSLSNISDINNEPTRKIEDVLGEIYQESRKVGIEYDDQRKIIESLNILKELRRTQIEANKKVPFLDKAIGAFVSTDRLKKIKEAKEKLNGIIARLHNAGIFEAKNNAFSNIYRYDIGQKIDEKKFGIISVVMRDTQTMFPNAEQSSFSGLADMLKDHIKRKEVNIGDIIKSNLSYNIEKNRIDKELQEKESAISQIVKRADMFAIIGNELTGMKSVIDSCSTRSDNYYETIANISKDAKVMYETRPENIRYIMEMQPKNIFHATTVGANINNILKNQNEESTLKQNLQDGIDRMTDNKYNVLLQRTIETDKNRWTNSKGMCSYVTIATKGLDFAGTQDIVRKRFSLDPRNYSDWNCPWGDSWGVGLVLFISGVPFDNIHNIVCSKDGYYDNYKDLESGQMFFHHAYMLEKGKLVKRNKVLNLEIESDKKLLLQDGKDIENTLSGIYEEVDIKTCL